VRRVAPDVGVCTSVNVLSALKFLDEICGQEAQLRALRAQEHPDTDAIGALAAQHAAAGKILSHLLGVLRATPRARMVPRGASRQLAQVPRVRPWEASDG